MHEPMVMQALLALSSAHKRKVLEPAKRVRDGLLPDTQEIFLLKQYGGAIKNMQMLLADDIRPTKQRLLLAVIMCGLFVLLEYMRGHYDAGYLHLTSGARLAKQLTNEPSETMSDSKLMHFFARLQDQSDMFRLQRLGSSELQTSTPSSPSAAITTTTLQFDDITEAGNHLDALIESLAHSAEQSRLIPSSAKASRRLLAEEHAYVLASFDAWLLAYDATMAAASRPETCADSAAWIALRQRYDMAMEMAVIGVGRLEIADARSDSSQDSES
ncbi:Nn.00g072490.m01.CDS01 [Neocucurbitaria sp. VM-36]